jgi:replicative DNA helicase
MARTALDHSKVVLGGVFPDNVEFADRAISQLTDVHFPDAHYRTLFLLMERILESYGSVLKRQQLEDILSSQKVDAGKVALYLETYDALSAANVSMEDFRWSVDQLKELAAERNTAEAITKGMEILNRGIQNDKGEELLGHQAARAHVLEQFADIDRELAKQDSPEGDAREEYDEILEEINYPKSVEGIKFGITALDNVVGGAHPGELNLIVGYTNSGKSMLASAQLPWSAAIEQGKNVVILTTETLRPQIRRRLLCRHSRHAMFGLPKGINSRDLKKGKDFLPADQLKVLPDIIDDFTKNPNYGKLVIVQVPRNATITSCENRVLRYQRDFQVDLVVVDSINLLRADRRYPSKREELASMLIEAKQFATTFDNGRGVPVYSPWQANRESWKEAQEKGFYNSSALAETHEASASSDTIVTILEPMGDVAREVMMKVQVPKHRDGEKASAMDISVDYATAFWSSDHRPVTNSGGIESLLGAGMLSGGGMFG